MVNNCASSLLIMHVHLQLNLCRGESHVDNSRTTMCTFGPSTLQSESSMILSLGLQAWPKCTFKSPTNTITSTFEPTSTSKHAGLLETLYPETCLDIFGIVTMETISRKTAIHCDLASSTSASSTGKMCWLASSGKRKATVSGLSLLVPK